MYEYHVDIFGKQATKLCLQSGATMRTFQVYTLSFYWLRKDGASS